MLKQQLQSVYEGVFYHCGYKSRHKGTVKKHVEAKHKGVHYNCSQCNYKTKWKHILKQHVESVHGGVFYNCDHCGYKATQKGRLK